MFFSSLGPSWQLVQVVDCGVLWVRRMSSSLSDILQRLSISGIGCSLLEIKLLAL